MPPTDHDKREQRILDAAESLVTHYGYDKTAVSDIAHEAGVSKGTIYLHYASKDDLFEALIDRETRSYVNDWLERVEADEENLTFVRMCRCALEAMAERPLLQALMRGDRRVFGSFWRTETEHLFTNHQQLRYELLQKMQAVGALRADLDMKTVAYIVNFTSYGMWNVQDIVPADEAPALEDVVATLAEMLQRILVPPDGGNQEAGRQVILEMARTIRRQKAVNL